MKRILFFISLLAGIIFAADGFVLPKVERIARGDIRYFSDELRNDIIFKPLDKGDGRELIFRVDDSKSFSLRKEKGKEVQIITALEDNDGQEITIFDKDGDGFPDVVVKEEVGVFNAYSVKYELVKIKK